MPKLTIDNRDVEVPEDATILDAAEKLDIEIPTLCFSRECEPATSCLVCLVKIGGNGRMVPACATAATDGLVVESETEDVHAARRSALELLLSDHLGDCLAPCWFGCPAQMNIPLMLRQIAAGDLRGAIATVKADIALPAVLGRVCPAPCEKVCRRHSLDGAVTICHLKQFVADADLATTDPYLPACAPPTGKHVAIIGGGPSGLAAAYYLAQRGHTCTIFDDNDRLGGRLLIEARSVSEVLQAEIAQIVRLGIEVRLGTRVGREINMPELHAQFDAVLIACGATAGEQAAAWGITASPHGIQVAKRTFQVGKGDSPHLPERPEGGHHARMVVAQMGTVPFSDRTFAIGNAIRGKGMIVRSVADGKEAAAAIDQFLSGRAATGVEHPFNTRIGRMEREELVQLSAGVGNAPRHDTAGGFAPQDAAAQAARCLHCDCRGVNTCKLRKYSALYHADPRHYQGERRKFQQDLQHADVVFEPGKCIDCGLCIQITAAAGEQLGLTYIGRGFNVRVGVPLGHSLAQALAKVAAECVAACPTAALAWKTEVF